MKRCKGKNPHKTKKEKKKKQRLDQKTNFSKTITSAMELRGPDLEEKTIRDQGAKWKKHHGAKPPVQRSSQATGGRRLGKLRPIRVKRDDRPIRRKKKTKKERKPRNTWGGVHESKRKRKSIGKARHYPRNRPALERKKKNDQKREKIQTSPIEHRRRKKKKKSGRGKPRIRCLLKTLGQKTLRTLEEKPVDEGQKEKGNTVAVSKKTEKGERTHRRRTERGNGKGGGGHRQKKVRGQTESQRGQSLK